MRGVIRKEVIDAGRLSRDAAIRGRSSRAGNPAAHLERARAAAQPYNSASSTP
jgi:hypothetical protein